MSGSTDTLFGDYRLLKRIAMGGMAEIYQAQRVGAAGFVRDVVIKRIHPEFSDDDDFIRMFVNEAKLAAMLRHPNIVQVMDFNNVDNTYYIAMELVEGLDLKRLRLRSQRANQRIPIPLTVRIVSEVLKGLAYAHRFTHRGESLHIVHRDISPQNILVSERGEVKLTDFGIARVLQHASLTAQGVLKGKAAYMAPEQTLSSRVDQRADLFSIGIVMWELLTGERLFQANNDILLMEKIRSHPILPPHMVYPAIPEELSQVTMKALSRDVNARFPDAAAFGDALRPWLQSPHLQEELGKLVSAFGTRRRGAEAPVEEAELPGKKRQTAQLSGWQPPSAKAKGSESNSSASALFVPAESLTPSSSSSFQKKSSTEDEAGKSWGSFPAYELNNQEQADTEEEWSIREAAPDDWDSTATDLEPSKILAMEQQTSAMNPSASREESAPIDLEETIMADIALEETVMVDPAALLAMVKGRKKQDLPTEKEDDLLSTVQMSPEEYLQLRAENPALQTLTDLPRKDGLKKEK
ncbi:MAG: serine/threonine protein kinase [Deltaproteobacteria bacterium]|nr:MAG: serine/threonine protein kinase [Deltaproteobacteria bacterium]